MTSPMYPHAATAYTRLPEEGGRAGWKRTVLTGVRLSGSEGSKRSAGADRGASSALLIVPAKAMGGYVSPGAFSGSGWTLRPGDMVCPGSAPDPKPPKGAIPIGSVEAVRIGSGIHHLEAHR